MRLEEKSGVSYGYRHSIHLYDIRLWPELTVSTVVRTLFLIVTASFTSVMVTCISWFNCTKDLTIGVEGIHGSVVYAFPAISCYSSAYVGWSWVMGGCIVLWLLVVALTVCWLAIHRQQVAILQSRSTADSDVPLDRWIVALSSLALQPQVQSTRKVPTNLWIPFIRWTRFAWFWPIPLSVSVAGVDGLDEPVCASGFDDVNMETCREYAFRSVYGALYDSFRPNAIGWNVVIWMRRLLLIFLSVLLTYSPSAKYMSFAFLHVIIACLQVYYQPFASSILNEMEQVSILVHTFMAIVLNAYPSPTNADVQSAILTLTIGPLISYFIYRLAQSYLLAKKSHKQVKAIASNQGEGMSASLLSSNELEFHSLDNDVIDDDPAIPYTAVRK